MSPNAVAVVDERVGVSIDNARVGVGDIVVVREVEEEHGVGEAYYNSRANVELVALKSDRGNLLALGRKAFHRSPDAVVGEVDDKQACVCCFSSVPPIFTDLLGHGCCGNCTQVSVTLVEAVLIFYGTRNCYRKDTKLP